MAVRPRTGSARLAGPLGVSAVLHASLLVVAFVARGTPPKALPPIYKVSLVAAPAGPRSIGEVSPTPPAPTPAPKEPPAPPKRAETKATDMPAPTKSRPARRPTAPATPTPEPKSSPKNAPPTRAGGGPTGGTGADVANVKTEGLDFPYPSYLQNIVRQIALRFKPRNPGALRAEVYFVVQRDGTVSQFRFVTRSGVYAFDLEAQGAVEAAAGARAFGALPDGYVNDFLPVVFSFDPSLFR